MRISIAVLAAGMAALLLAGPAGGWVSAAKDSTHDIGRLNWLAGCWERQGAERHTIEQWTTPRGGMMLGLNQTTAGGRTIAWEFLRIAIVDGRLVLTALPSGQAEASFDATELTDSAVVFTNPEHDFPQRIIYARVAGDSLVVRVEAGEGDDARSLEWRMARTGCPA